MLKILLVLLVLINAALAALIGGYLEAWIPNGHEPQRLQQQINPEKIRLVGGAASTLSVDSTASPNPIATVPSAVPLAATNAVNATNASNATAAAMATVASAPDAVACIELGDFNEAEANRLQTALATLLPTDRLARRRVSDANSFMVYIPPQGDKASADRKAGELRRLGISDFYVLQNEGALSNGVSLGVFKTRTAAEAHLAELVKKGVRSARIAGRGQNSLKVAFQLRGLDDKAVAAAVKLAGAEQRDCAPL